MLNKVSIPLLNLIWSGFYEFVCAMCCVVGWWPAGLAGVDDHFCRLVTLVGTGSPGQCHIMATLQHWLAPSLGSSQRARIAILLEWLVTVQQAGPGSLSWFAGTAPLNYLLHASGLRRERERALQPGLYVKDALLSVLIAFCHCLIHSSQPTIILIFF